MNKKELLIYIINNPEKFKVFFENTFKKLYPILYIELIKYTNHLNITYFQQKLWHYLYEIKEKTKCEYCKVNDNNYLNFRKGYRKFCSRLCQKRNSLKIIEKNDLEKYGCRKFASTEYKNWQKEYNLEKFGVENIFTKGSIGYNKTRSKIKNDHGVENISQLKETKEKVRETNEEVGKWLKKDQFKLFKEYTKHVNRITKNNKIKLFKNWNGYDYYDNEYIKDYLKLDQTHKLYPTVDHKISIKYGYENNIDYNIIANINNLCITKKIINSTKHYKTEDQFNFKNSHK